MIASQNDIKSCLLLMDTLIMPILSAFTDTITLLLNTPIVPPPDNVSTRVIALTDLPKRHRGQRDGQTIERTLSGRSEAADVFAFGVSSYLVSDTCRF
ncbi:hypothetical protein BDN67DRAFT_969847 [Paxillus ammoniavirescens]|nr:hypothetical protein BDN67DRAFT_969847 [Paxillus ammoniavirescens]